MRWTVSKKLGLGFGGTMVLIAIIAVTAYTNIQGLVAHQKKAMLHTAAIKDTYELWAVGNFGNAAIRGYHIALGNSEQRARIKNASMKSTWERLAVLAAKLKERSQDFDSDEQKKLAADLVTVVREYQTEQEDGLRLMDSGNEQDLQKITEKLQKNTFVWSFKLREDVAQLLVSLNKEAENTDAAAATSGDRALWAILLSSAVALVLGVVLIVILTRRIAHPLRQAASKIGEAEQQGDLTVQVAAKSDDEVGEICTAFNSFVQKLHGAVGQTASTAEQVASASEEIAAAAGQAAAGADSQQQHATQAATAMQEMTASIQQVADHSNTAAGAARSAAQAAKNGGQVVEASLTSMRSIASSVSDTATKIAELGKRSDQIGRIVNVIDDIADQTNLLALNAAIEAARAGDQGRGFAVVADEVRKLAERTTKATHEIAQMITAMQEETKRAIDTMQAGTAQVQQGVEQTSQAGASLQEIIAAAEKVGDMVAQIATAATEQAATTLEVSSNVEQIARITNESSSGAQQSARACRELTGLALELQKLVSQFRLGEEVSGASTATPQPRTRAVRSPLPPHVGAGGREARGKVNGHGGNGRANSQDELQPFGASTRVH
jgi:methyl-accepting chemotaxis protein